MPALEITETRQTKRVLYGFERNDGLLPQKQMTADDSQQSKRQRVSIMERNCHGLFALSFN